MKVDASRAECIVISYKEGVLSRVGHDIKLRCERFDLTIEEGRVEATFDAGSLAVVCALKNGRDNPGALSAKDKRQIVDNVRRSILHPDRFPEIRFASTEAVREGNALRVRGDLTLHGVTRPISVTARRVAGEWFAEVDLHQPDFGIAPFSALMGTLKVKPTIKVRITAPAE